MGCEQSKLSHNQTTLSYSVIDPSYLKPSNKNLRASLQQNGIIVKTYMSVDCFISDQVDSYSNNVVVRQRNLAELLLQLKQIKSNPKIFVIAKEQAKNTATQQNLDRVTYIQSYGELLLKNLDHRAELAVKQNKRKQIIDLKLLKDFRGDGEPQLFIFEETLKIKGISYKIYSTFQELQTEMELVQSKVVVTDYVFQNQVVDLLKYRKTKIICFCNLMPEQSYNTHVYFITNNFQQIANQVAMLKSFQILPLPISKLFLCSKNSNFFRFKDILEKFGLLCRDYKDIHQILKIAKYYFSLMIICPEDQKSSIQKQLQGQGLSFRVQLFGISQEAQNSVQGLRKVIREVKRGYLVERGVCKTVDIIDRYHNSSKFQNIKAELQKNHINYRCYDDFNSYTKKMLYCSPFVICNFSQRNLVYRFLEQAQSKSKVIIFCNKSKIGEQLLTEQKWAFVSSHFGKIINFLTGHKIIVPVVLDQNQQRIHLKQEKIKNKQHRISALKWSDPNLSSNRTKQYSKPANNQMFSVSYIVPKSNITQLQVKQICYDASTLLKLDYHPVDNIVKFKNQLTASLMFLIEKYKLKYLETVFSQLFEGIKEKSLRGLSKRVREFFGEEKEIGFKLNESMKRIQSLDQKQLKHLREIIYLLNFNFINYYQMPKIGSFKLVHWTKETLLESCLEEGIIIFKDFLVMYEEGSFQPIQDCLKLQLQIEYNTLNDQNTNINPYFCYQGRYIFAPYTQFKLNGKIKQNESVACLELVKQPDFLQYYFNENINCNLIDFYESQAKIKSTIIEEEEYQTVQKNLQRSAVLKLWQTSQHTKAVIRQKQLVKRQEQTENIDERYLIELLLQLANYQLKAGLTDDFLTTVQEITQNNACPYIRKECSKLLQKLSSQIQKEEKSKKTTKLRSRKCIELRQNLNQLNQLAEQQENIFRDQKVKSQQNLFQNQNCLQIDDIQQHFEIIK